MEVIYKSSKWFKYLSLLNTQPYDPLMDQMRRMIHQNRIDTYYEPAGDNHVIMNCKHGLNIKMH